MTPRVGVRAGLAAALMLSGAMAAVLRPGISTALIAQAMEVVRHAGPAGLILAIAAQVLVAASGLLPASLVGVAAGAVYGVGLGSIVAAGSTLAGALLTFLISRKLFGSTRVRLLADRPRLQVLDRMVARDGWKLVCLLRASPVMPFAATSYALGLTSMGTVPYVVGTLASLPTLMGYVVMGRFADAALAAWTDGLGATRVALLAVGLLATGLAALRVGQLVVRAMRTADNLSPLRT